MHEGGGGGGSPHPLPLYETLTTDCLKVVRLLGFVSQDKAIYLPTKSRSLSYPIKHLHICITHTHTYYTYTPTVWTRLKNLGFLGLYFSRQMGAWCPRFTSELKSYSSLVSPSSPVLLVMLMLWNSLTTPPESTSCLWWLREASSSSGSTRSP